MFLCLYFSLFTQDSTLSAGSEWELADSNGLDASVSLASSDSPAVCSSSNASETPSLCLSQVSALLGTLLPI